MLYLWVSDSGHFEESQCLRNVGDHSNKNNPENLNHEMQAGGAVLRNFVANSIANSGRSVVCAAK
jgi:hypothetical protein